MVNKLSNWARSAVAAVFVLAGAGVALAQTQKDWGPPEGAPLPHDLALTAASGETVSFDSVKGENGAVLFFVRSADWCPYCQAQLLELNSSAAEFTARGYAPVSISYDSVDKLAAFTSIRSVSYEMLSDPDSAVIDAFGVRDPQYAGGRADGVPQPIVFIVDADGVIRAKLWQEGYRERPPIDEILDALDAVRESASS
ncbi:MAG: peroxiredoxin family protein [Maricaulaceae bacterium]